MDQVATTTDVCRQIHDNVDECLAVGVVDLGSGMMMGVHHHMPLFTQAYLDAIAAASVEMFRGKTVRGIEELLSTVHGTQVKDTFEEIFIASPGVFHFMAVIRDKGAVVVMVTKKGTDQGLGWAALRNAMGPTSVILDRGTIYARSHSLGLHRYPRRFLHGRRRPQPRRAC